MEKNLREEYTEKIQEMLKKHDDQVDDLTEKLENFSSKYNKNKEKHLDTVKKYYQANKDKIYEYIKEKRGQDKINSVDSKLENMSMEELAKILIEARKTKLLEV